MLITGASGHALEVLDILQRQIPIDKISFFDNISPEISNSTIKKFRILRSVEELSLFFKADPFFVLGTGNPAARKLLMNFCLKAGGEMRPVISDQALISNIETNLGEGLNIMHGACIQPHVKIGKGSLVNCRAVIHHECEIGEFCEISPGAILAGNVVVGNNTFIGSGAVILPKVRIGSNVTIAAGAVVKIDLPDNVMAAGVPAIVKKFS